MRYAAVTVVMAVLLAAVAPAVIAQQGPGGGPGMPGGGGKEFAPEKFPEVKARVLKMLDERKANLEQERACVEKATNHEELRKCRPERPMGPGGHGGPGGTGGPGMHPMMQPGAQGGK